MLGLGERAIGAGRRDLERPVLEQVAKQAGDALAERDVDPARAIDDEPQALGGGPLEREQLDVRLLSEQPVLDLLL